MEIDSEGEEDEEEDRGLLFRTRTLFVRSILSSLTIVASELSSFYHPYIKRTLQLSLPLHGVARLGDIERDVDRCLSSIAAKIPPRLSVPTLLETTPSILSTGHNAAGRFAELLAEVWMNLDRNTVVAHLHGLSTIATLLMDYRRVHGDQSEEAGEVDDTVADAVVELCLKLTESELKAFLARLSEWRDVDMTSDSTAGEATETEWRQYARAVSFYALIEALSEKLKSLFVPSMAALWTNASELLAEFQEVVAATVASKGKKSTAESSSSSKSKKRSAEEFTEDVQSSSNAVADDKTITEMIALTKKVLSCVRLTCTNDTDATFIDEVRQKK